MIALIDLDPLPYAYGSITFEDGALLPDKLLRKMVDEKIESIVQGSGADDWVGFLTDSSSNFRINIATILPYKGNRTGSEKPPRYQMLRDYLLDNYPSKVTLVKGMEADDALSIAQYANLELSETLPMDHPDFHNTIICTIDKDLNMVPGWHYGWSKGNSPETAPWFQDKLGGLRCFYKQLLTGDPTDNIKGLYGVGAKSVLVSRLDEFEDEEPMYTHVRDEYVKRFGTYADQFLLENARLLWMLEKEGEMWNPPIIIKEEEENVTTDF